MELDRFIEETLMSIQKGIKNANIKIAKEEGEAVRTNGAMQYIIDSNRSGEKDRGIVFDVAITVTSERSKGGAGKVSVVGFSLGGGKNTIASEENVSRIKFKVDPFNSIY